MGKPTPKPAARRPAMPKRLRILLVASFFQSFVFWYAIEKLFMHSIGLNDQAIAISLTIFTAIMAIANVPFGILADRWSRKGVLILANLLFIASSVVCGLSNGFWMYTIGACLWGLYYAGASGLYDSIIYDLLIEEEGHADHFERYYGRQQVFESLALILGALCSTAVAHFLGLRGAFFATIPVTCLCLIALCFFKEPGLHKKELSGKLIAHIRATFAAVKQKGVVAWIVVSLLFVTVALRFTFEFSQLWLIALLLPAAWFGPAAASLLAGCGLGGWLAGKLKDNRLTTGTVGMVAVTASLAALVHASFIVIIGQVISLTAFIMLSVLLGKQLHDNLPSKVRAGASSVVVALGYGLFLPLGPLFGFISNRHTVFAGAWIPIGITLALGISLAGLIITIHKSGAVVPVADPALESIQEYPK